MVRIVKETEHTGDFGENTITPVYRITGIPSVTAGTITVVIEYEGSTGTENYLAAGEVHEMLEPEEEVTTYALYPAADSSGYLVAAIPPLKGEAGTDGDLKSAGIYTAITRVIYGVSHMTVYKGTYFNYTYPSNTDRQKILQLAQYMDDAMRAFFELKLTDHAAFDAAAALFGKPTVVVTKKTQAKRMPMA